MKLTKEQALDLIKVLSHYETLVGSCPIDSPTRYATLGSLQEFVLGEDEDSCEADDDCEDEETDDEEDEEDDGEDEEDSSEEDDPESDESEDEEGDEADDAGEEDDDGSAAAEEELDPDAYALGSELHDLKVAKAKVISSSVGDPDDEVTLEFEHTEGDDADICDLLVSGEPVGPITHVRRKGTELHVAENNGGSRNWHRFHVARFPKGWADALPLGDLVEIE